ncbi:DNA-binding protein Ewg [Anthophora plagiata]
MRYSTLQEQEYGVPLPQSRLSSETNESTMTDADTMELKNNLLEEGSVVSNLPLLFANGHPTSLETITVTQLERFVTFMVQCSLDHDTNESMTEPRWWPKEVKFSNPLIRPKRINDNWTANLKKLVFRCYTYHRSEYLLRFCSYLARYPKEDLEYVNNWDSTTSLYHKTTGKLLVTFRNENMNYDRRYESPRKKLLSCSGVTSCYSNKSKQEHSNMMVQPSTGDIYLCDNCDAEFIGLEKMKEHERVCCEQGRTDRNSRPTTPDLPSMEPELRQNQFLEYFRLCSVKSELKSVETNNAKKSKAMTEETQQERLERIERHLIAPVLNSSSRPKWLEAEVDHDRWIVTYKPNREKSACDYVHQYKFVNSVKQKPIDNKETMIENQDNARPNVSSKRKAPSDEQDTNTVEEDERIVTSEANNENLTALEDKSVSDKNMPAIITSIEEETVYVQRDAITVIDLCSSDEEESPCINVSSDENRDPMDCTTGNVTKSLQEHSSVKFHVKPHICSTEQKDECFSDTISNDDSENCTTKYHGTMLNTRTSLSSILRPAP